MISAVNLAWMIPPWEYIFFTMFHKLFVYLWIIQLPEMMCTQIGFWFPIILNKGLCFKIKALASKYPKFLSVFLVCPFYFLNSPIICSRLNLNMNLIKHGLKQLAHFTHVNNWHRLLGGSQLREPCQLPGWWEQCGELRDGSLSPSGAGRRGIFNTHFETSDSHRSQLT